ncbi:MAG: biotin transporter BioY [Sphaerochaeta sp.]|jgi:biotin transport system substrate-specific component|nr:biotin transporter BioY [Spirochaetales bacterium]
MNTRKTVLTALFASLIIVGAYIRFPLPPVPITLQTLFVISAALLGGTAIGIGSVSIYLLLGAVGLPVFTAGGGLGILLGPTGGFLFGLLPAALLAGIAGNYVKNLQPGQTDNPKHTRTYLILSIFFGIMATLAIYAVGVPFLKYNRSLSWKVAIQVGMLPFLIGDTIKLIVSVQLSQMFAPRVKEFLQGDNQ